jgi:hypothetical protein
MKMVSFVEYVVYLETAFGPTWEVYSSRNREDAEEQRNLLLEDGSKAYIEPRISTEWR